MTRKFLVLLCLVLFASAAQAESVYVVDKLIITMRSGQGNQYQIVRTWPSGTRLDVLETAEQYTRVRGPDNTEGWVLNQYIQSQPTAKILLDAAQSKLAKLEAENAKLKKETGSTSETNSALSKELNDLQGKYKKQENELTRLRSVAAKPLKLDNENQQLKKDNLKLENERELLRQENQVLQDSSDRDWFINGALVIIAGIVIGLIAPRLRPRKKSSWGSL
jgi:SH3 domain protein